MTKAGIGGDSGSGQHEGRDRAVVVETANYVAVEVNAKSIGVNSTRHVNRTEFATGKQKAMINRRGGILAEDTHHSGEAGRVSVDRRHVCRGRAGVGYFVVITARGAWI